MAAPLKDKVGAGSIGALAAALADVPGFDGPGFPRRAQDGLDGLELKARIAHVARALAAALPGPFVDDGPRVAAAVAAAELDMWAAWPAQTWVEERGLADPGVALSAIAAMTARASGEFAVRAFLDAHAKAAWTAVRGWAGSDDVHRRRLASEGTRPRLPWGRQVAALLADPLPGLAVIEALREDAEPSVRRSVANHLNDVARDHPEVALAAGARWRAAGGRHVDEVLARGLRGLVKRGEPRALGLLGVDAGTPVDVEGFVVDEPAVAIGGDVRFRARLTAPEGGAVAVDYAIAYVGARGTAKAPKVFKLGVRTLEPGGVWRIDRRHAMRHVSVRRLHPGPHRLLLQVNGAVRAEATFDLTA